METTFVQKAKNYIKEFHREHIRASGETYAEHTLRVFGLLVEVGIEDKELLTAALLHHVLNFDDSNLEFIKNDYGERVLELLRITKHFLMIVSVTSICTISMKPLLFKPI
jgi:guanosine-3',5'-bis(diphosphate) 3'-pyrophosphohydrolase